MPHHLTVLQCLARCLCHLPIKNITYINNSKFTYACYWPSAALTFLKGCYEYIRISNKCPAALSDSESKLLQISEQTPSTSMEISGKVHSSTSSESTACAARRECVCICVHGALQKHIVKISGQEGLYCVAEAECSSYSPAAGPAAWGWHQHKDKNVMWGISKASFKANPQDALYTWTLSLFNNIW